MELIKPGDVLFVWGNGLIADTIEFITHGPSHVTLFIGEDLVCEAQGGRSIGERPLSFYTESARVEIWRDITLTDGERAEMVRYAKTLYGAPYDYALIPLELAHFELGFGLMWYHETKQRICSTYVNDVAAHIGRKWTQVTNPAPVDILNGGVLTKVYDWEDGRWVTNKSA